MGKRRSWTILLVPPDAGGRTRRLAIGVRPLQTVATLVIATVAATGLWASANATDVTITADRLAEAQRTILALHDTVHVLRGRVSEIAALDSAPELMLPVDGTLTSRFTRSRLHPLLQIFRPHQGIDLSAPAGTKIIAPANAVVSFVGWRFGDGLMVELTHTGGVTTRYAHCRSTLVRTGERVTIGQGIATVGTSGLATGPHVHFEVLVRGKPVDPLRYLAASRDSATAVAEKLRSEDP